MSIITINNTIQAPVKDVYLAYLSPADNLQWNTAGYGWTTSFAEIEPIVGGKFAIGYKSPDEINDFVFIGSYTKLINDELIAYTLDDGRKVEVLLQSIDKHTTQITINFEAESTNPIEMQQTGWMAVLTNFSAYVERKSKPEFAAIHKKITINTSKKTIWSVLLNHDNYRVWTAPFSEGSTYTGEMAYGKTVQFLSADGGGLSAEIKVCIPEYQVSFEFLGEVAEKNQKSSWVGYRETYTLVEHGGITDLIIYVEVLRSEYEEVNNAWDEALQIVKKLCEDSDM